MDSKAEENIEQQPIIPEQQVNPNTDSNLQTQTQPDEISPENEPTIEKKLDSFIELAGNENRYQFLLVFMTLIIWINVEFLSIILPFLEKEPLVNFRNPITGHEATNVLLNYTMCDFSSSSYNITERFTYSWVSQFDIECNRLKTGLMGSILFSGVMMGALSFQFFANKFGRKKTGLFSLFCFGLTLSCAPLVNSIYFAYAILLVGGFFTNLIALATYVLVGETVSAKKRAISGSIINTGFSLCGIFYFLLFLYLEQASPIFLIGAGIALVICVVYFFVIHESPRYFIIKKNFDKFLITVKLIAKSNKRLEIVEEVIENNPERINQLRNHINKNDTALLETADNLDNCSEFDKFSSHDKDYHMKALKKNSSARGTLDLLIYPSVRYNFIILCVLWFCISGNYFGLAIHLKSLPGNMYVNGIIVYLIEAVAYFIAGTVVNIKFFGRKRVFAMFYMISITGFLSMQIFDVGGNYGELVFTFIARFAVAGNFNLFYTYSLEIYPTTVRAQGIGINSFFCRLSSVLVPMVLELYEEQVNLIFVVINILSLFLLFFLPETLDRPMEDDIYEIVHNVAIDKKNTKNSVGDIAGDKTERLIIGEDDNERKESDENKTVNNVNDNKDFDGDKNEKLEIETNDN